MLQRLKLSFIAILSVLLMAGCDSIITDPNPLIGCYKISISEGGYSYAFGLHEDNSFEMLQYAGDSCYASIGTYAIELSSFDFKSEFAEASIKTSGSNIFTRSICNFIQSLISFISNPSAKFLPSLP